MHIHIGNCATLLREEIFFPGRESPVGLIFRDKRSSGHGGARGAVMGEPPRVRSIAAHGAHGATPNKAGTRQAVQGFSEAEATGPQATR